MGDILCGEGKGRGVIRRGSVINCSRRGWSVLATNCCCSLVLYSSKTFLVELHLPKELKQETNMYSTTSAYLYTSTIITDCICHNCNTRDMLHHSINDQTPSSRNLSLPLYFPVIIISIPFSQGMGAPEAREWEGQTENELNR